MTTQFHHIAVLMGGWSSERDVSLRSGAACAGALEQLGYRVTPIDVNRDIADRLAILKPDACFNALHGKWGEDGCIQGVLETLEIPYTHSGVLASALAMDKARAKVIFKAAGVPVADGIVASREEAARGHLMPPPYVIKPVSEGSSVGVYLVREDQEHPPQELTRPDWSLRRPPRRALHWRPGADLRRHGRSRARHHRDPARRRPEFLRLRSKIRKRRLTPHSTGTNFTGHLQVYPKIGS